MLAADDLLDQVSKRYSGFYTPTSEVAGALPSDRDFGSRMIFWKMMDVGGYAWDAAATRTQQNSKS